MSNTWNDPMNYTMNNNMTGNMTNNNMMNNNMMNNNMTNNNMINNNMMNNNMMNNNTMGYDMMNIMANDNITGNMMNSMTDNSMMNNNITSNDMMNNNINMMNNSMMNNNMINNSMMDNGMMDNSMMDNSMMDNSMMNNGMNNGMMNNGMNNGMMNNSNSMMDTMENNTITSTHPGYPFANTFVPAFEFTPANAAAAGAPPPATRFTIPQTRATIEALPPPKSTVRTHWSEIEESVAIEEMAIIMRLCPENSMTAHYQYVSAVLTDRLGVARSVDAVKHIWKNRLEAVWQEQVRVAQGENNRKEQEHHEWLQKQEREMQEMLLAEEEVNEEGAEMQEMLLAEEVNEEGAEMQAAGTSGASTAGVTLGNPFFETTSPLAGEQRQQQQPQYEGREEVQQESEFRFEDFLHMDKFADE